MRVNGHLELALACAGVLALGCASAPRSASPAATTEPKAAGAVALPPGQSVAFELHARGTQNYACRAKADAPTTWGWVLVAPEAELLDAGGRTVGKHYQGPTWEISEDGSKVAARVVARGDAPEPDAVPWLLLQVTEPSAGGMFAGVKSVQRIDTHGGKAPPGGCDASAAEQVVKVPYTASYAFAR